MKDPLGTLSQNATVAILPQNHSITSPLLTDSEPVPGPSQQTISSQEDLQDWLIKTRNQLLFLSEQEHSNSFTLLVSTLNKELLLEASEKNCIEFLLALDDFSSKDPHILLATQFFIEKNLKKTRFLIDHYRDYSSQLGFYTENLNPAHLSEDLKNLQDELQQLKKEKNQLEKSQQIDSHIIHLTELTRDFEKLRVEQHRDFEAETVHHEATLETYKQELETIESTIESNEKEWVIPFEQVEVDIQLNRKKLFNLQGDLYFLQQLEKQIENQENNQEDTLTLDTKLLRLSYLEEVRLGLITELENFDSISILKKIIEEPNSNLEQLRTENKIRTEFKTNSKDLNAIIEDLKDILNFFSIDSFTIINIFLTKIKFILSLFSDIRDLEEKTIEISKQIRKNQAKFIDDVEENKTIKDLTTQFGINKDRFNSLHVQYTQIQKELFIFLETNCFELKKIIKEIIDIKTTETIQLQNKQLILELLIKRNGLINQIDELEEKIHAIKNDQKIFKLLKDHKMLENLILLERLQKKADETTQKIERLYTQITELENNITELKKDMDPSKFQLNNKKIKNLENKKIEFYANLNKLQEEQQCEIQLEISYRKPVESTINHIRNNQTSKCPILLSQKERSLRFNLLETKRLNQKIEKLKNNAAKNKQDIKIKQNLDRIEKLLFKSCLESTQRSISEERIFFQALKAQLISLKDQVDNQNWNKSGWGFFYKKIPDGIKKIRTIYNKYTLDHTGTEIEDGQEKLMLLSLFSEIYFLLNKKTSTNSFFRSRAVQDLYQSLQTSTNHINCRFFALQNPVAEKNDNSQPTCSTFSHS